MATHDDGRLRYRPWRRAMQGLVLTTALLLLWGCMTIAGPGAKFRYRLDIMLTVDGAPLVGSVVQERRVRNAGGTGNPFPRYTIDVNGQALVLPIPSRPTLIVAMVIGQGDYFRNAPLFACGLRHGGGNDTDAFIRRVAEFKGSCELDGKEQPEILAISDPQDGFTLSLADAGDLSKSFGAGVEFVGMRITTTDEPLTTGIETVFPWLIVPDGQHWQDFILNRIDIGIRLHSAFITRQYK